MTALPDWEMAGDAELAGAAAAGDRAAFAGIYDRYADRLHDFCIGMVRDRDAAADCVQEVFCTAAAQLATLRDPDKLRPWLYAIARNEALRCIRLRRRENVSDELPERQSSDAGPDTLAGRTELAELIAEAAGGLSDRDRAVLELTYRHGLDGPELAEALGVSPGNATKLVSRLRETVERSLGALLVARRAQRNPQGCAELAGILANWDGRFSVLLRKRVARHIDSCTICERNRRDLVSPAALLGVAPIFVAAPWWLRGQTLSKVQLTSADIPMAADTSDSHSDSAAETGYQQCGRQDGQSDIEDSQARRTRNIQAATVLVGMVIIALGLTFLWLHHQKTSVAPSDVTVNTHPPTEASTPPAAVTAPQPQAPPPQPQLSNPVPAPIILPPQAPGPINTPPPAAPAPNPPVAPQAPPPPVIAPVPAPPPVRIPPPSLPAGPPPSTISKPSPTRIPPPPSKPPVPPSGPNGRLQ
jgi:RNA polymerase sigma factor (sigma-70 family)